MNNDFAFAKFPTIFLNPSKFPWNLLGLKVEETLVPRAKRKKLNYYNLEYNH